MIPSTGGIHRIQDWGFSGGEAGGAEEHTESTEETCLTQALKTQWGEKLFISASSGNFVVPYRDLAMSGLNGLMHLTGRGWIRWMNGDSQEVERDGQRGRDTWRQRGTK